MLRIVYRVLYIEHLFQLVFYTTLKNEAGCDRCMSMTGVSSVNVARSVCDDLGIDVVIEVQGTDEMYLSNTHRMPLL